MMRRALLYDDVTITFCHVTTAAPRVVITRAARYEGAALLSRYMMARYKMARANSARRH